MTREDLADKINMRAKTKPSKRPVKKVERPIGLAKNQVKILKSFWKPLPDEQLDAFEGKS
jgi:hypothetical protein